MSLRIKVILTVFLTQMMLVSAVVYTFIEREHVLVKEILKDGYLSFFQIVATTFSDLLDPEDVVRINNYVEEIKKRKEVLYVLVQDKESKILIDTGKEFFRGSFPNKISLKTNRPIIQDLESFPIGFFQKDRLLFNITIPILKEKEKIGLLRVGISSQQMNEEMIRSLYKGIGIIFIAGIIGAIIGLMVDRKLKKVLFKLIGATKRVSEGDLSQGVDIKTGDELEILGNSFNQMAQSIKEREDKIESLIKYQERILKSLSDGIIVLNQNFEVTFWNPAMERIYGKRIEEVMGKEVMDIFPGIFKEDFSYQLKRVLRGEILPQQDVSFDSAYGEMVCASATWFPLVDEHCSIIGVVGRITDITQQRIVENELVEIKNTLQTIFDGISAGIFLISKDYKIVLANKYQGELIGKEPKEFIGKECFKEFKESDKVCDFCPGTRAMKSKKKEEIELEFTTVTRPGWKTPVHIDAYPVIDASGMVTGFIEYIQDIATRKELEQRLKDYTEHLEQMVEERTNELKESQAKLIQSGKLAAIGELAGGVAHEINNPTGVILATTQFLTSIAEEVNLSENLKKSLEKINRNAERIAKITQGLLAFSRQTPTERYPLDVNRIIEESLLLVDHQLKVENIRLIRDFKDSMPQIMANSNQLQQVILNILKNAIDAMPKGGELLIRTSKTMDSSEKKGNNQVEILIQDTGVGIKKEFINKIFDPFFTTKEVNKGTGLGLSISYGIIKDHGGVIDVESIEGEGSKFYIRFPIKEELLT